MRQETASEGRALCYNEARTTEGESLTSEAFSWSVVTVPKKLGAAVFASRLTAARKRRRMTQDKLAELLSCSRASVQRWERGLDVPSALTMLRIADTLHVSMNWLLGINATPERAVFPSHDERHLLDLYRELPEEWRPRLLETAKDLLKASQPRQKIDR